FKLISAHEANARELIIGDAALEGDALVFDLEPYAVKTFLLKCSRCKTSTDTQTAVPLPYNLRISSRQGENITGALKDGLCVPEELIPGCVESGETVFTVKKEGKNAVRCEGQIIDLPPGAARISLLAASGKGDSTAVFTLGSHEIKKTVPDMLEAFAKWDMLAAGETGYVKCGIPALVFTHMHGENGDEIGRQCMFFNIELDVPNGARALVLPDDNEIFVLSASFASRPKAARPAIRLCETLERRECDFVYTDEEKSKSISSKSEQKRCKRKSDLRYAEIRLTRELARFRK
ncbi:MAG: hypothetical protein GX851_07305, partial [Clostridiales bacterium]|nr:hypothetical protein [Clostridiales bacterium]